MNDDTNKNWLDSEVNEKLFEFVKIAVNEYYAQKQIYSPHKLIEIMNIVSAGQAVLNEEIGKLEAAYAKFYSEHRGASKSDKQVENSWKTTEKGQRHIEIKYRLKGYAVVLSAVKKTLNQMELEARNLV